MISKDQVRQMAHLGRLNLDDQEVAEYQRELNEILQAAEKLKSVDKSEVEPTAHAQPIYNVMRDDETTPSLSQEQALANGPQVINGYFRVPRIMEGE